jgi:hypothetical protein
MAMSKESLHRVNAVRLTSKRLLPAPRRLSRSPWLEHGL